MQEMQFDGVALAVGRALDVADLVDPHSLRQNSVGRAEALPDLERADQCRAGLCLRRQAGVGFEHNEGNFEVGQCERGGETDRSGADDGDGILGLQRERAAVHRHTPPRRLGRPAADGPESKHKIVRQTFFTSAELARNKSIAFGISMCQYIFENRYNFR